MFLGCSGVPDPGRDPEALLALLRDSGAADSSPSDFVALVGVKVALEAGDRELAVSVGEVAVRLAESTGERQLAHACLAQSAFKFRKDEKSLATFEEHCEAAIALGHAGTFCYERLAVLYEYRGEVERAVEVCRSAEATLSTAGDGRSAERFRQKAGTIRVRQEKSRRSGADADD